MPGENGARQQRAGEEGKDDSRPDAPAGASRGTAAKTRPGKQVAPLPRPRTPAQALTVGQVLSIQVYVEVGSPFGQPGGAVMLRIGIVMMRFASRIWNG